MVNSMKKRINAVGIIEIFIGILTLLSTLISLISAIALDYNIISFLKITISIILLHMVF